MPKLIAVRIIKKIHTHTMNTTKLYDPYADHVKIPISDQIEDVIFYSVLYANETPSVFRITNNSFDRVFPIQLRAVNRKFSRLFSEQFEGELVVKTFIGEKKEDDDKCSQRCENVDLGVIFDYLLFNHTKNKEKKSMINSIYLVLNEVDIRVEKKIFTTLCRFFNEYIKVNEDYTIYLFEYFHKAIDENLDHGHLHYSLVNIIVCGCPQLLLNRKKPILTPSVHQELCKMVYSMILKNGSYVDENSPINKLLLIITNDVLVYQDRFNEAVGIISEIFKFGIICEIVPILKAFKLPPLRVAYDAHRTANTYCGKIFKKYLDQSYGNVIDPEFLVLMDMIDIAEGVKPHDQVLVDLVIEDKTIKDDMIRYIGLYYKGANRILEKFIDYWNYEPALETFLDDIGNIING